jgi:hypothetical protein
VRPRAGREDKSYSFDSKAGAIHSAPISVRPWVSIRRLPAVVVSSLNDDRPQRVHGE